MLSVAGELGLVVAGGYWHMKNMEFILHIYTYWSEQVTWEMLFNNMGDITRRKRGTCIYDRSIVDIIPHDLSHSLPVLQTVVGGLLS